MPGPEASPIPPAAMSPPSAALPAELGDVRVPLRLTASRGALGIELYEPIDVGPLEVRALASTLPGLRFPLDLSGGVPVFRHRRGELERLELVLGLVACGRWLTPRLGDAIGALERPVTVWAAEHGLSVGLSAQKSALAFELLWAPSLGDARFVVMNARAARLDAPALGHALRVIDTALGAVAERRGRIVTLTEPAQKLARAVLPAVGARAPSTTRVRFGSLEVVGDEVRVVLDSSFEPPALPAAVSRALELGELTREADDALAEGDLDRARAGYLVALEQAPRHPELARLIAEIDVCVGGRAEAALGMIVECVPATDAGWVGAELLAKTGDLDGARAAVGTLARGEPFAPMSALSWQRLSELESHAAARVDALDRAVATAPGLALVRWARFTERVELGDVEGALADAEHLEAGASGARARHDACSRAARALLARGFVRDAGRLFERALRYLPDDAAATAGLARALMEAGKSERAFTLLSRAVALSERQGRADADALIDMARLLATNLKDLPQAIARVRQVPATSARAIEAAALEAEWRAAIGDVSGASLAWARLRDRIELASEPEPAVADFLLHAARFEREVQRDVLAAERHLAVALRVAPRDASVAEAYREVAAVVAARARLARDRGLGGEGREAGLDTLPPPSAGEALPLLTSRPPAPDADADVDLGAEALADHERAERLENALRAEPGDTALALELSDVLERLGRDHDQYALLSGRLEDASAEDHGPIVERLARVLGRLVASARAEGQESVAELYEQALARLV